jgi:predicted LPLAT superfamily acyltransferase
MHLWLVRVLRLMDVRMLYAFSAVFVVPVCLILNDSRRIIYRYFRERHRYGCWKAAWQTYINHCMFSQVVIDRFAMYAGKRFHIDIDGLHHFTQLTDGPEAFIQLSAHIGNYEIAGYTLVVENKHFNALVFDGEKQSVMQHRSEMFADTNIRMIPVSKDMNHLFLIDHALQEGEVVSMPADRLLGSKKTVCVTLLGAEASLPMGPFNIAAMRGLDVLAVNVMKSSTKRYHVYVTPLTYDKQAPRRQQIQELATAYAAELERMLTMYPAQWYNYFPFWEVKSDKQ